MQIDLLLCRAWSVSNRRRDFWYRGHTESELRTFWQRTKAVAALAREQAAVSDVYHVTLTGRHANG